MPKASFDKRLAWSMAVLIVVIIALIPFHAIVTVWAASVVGHYTALRLWKEYLLFILTVAAGYLVMKDTPLRQWLTGSWLARLIAAYGAVQLLWGAAAYYLHQVTLFALAYGWLADLRYLVFFLDVLVIARLVPRLASAWLRFVFWPAAVVAVFGLLQRFILPYDFLRHLGYSQATIFPYEDINHNIHYIRVMATMRGSNPLGAYLVVVLSLLSAYWLQWRRAVGRRLKLPARYYPAIWVPLLGVVACMVLVFTFSRSAWLGLLSGIACCVWLSLPSKRLRRYALMLAAACVLIGGGVALGLRHSATFQNVFFHTQAHSAVATSSDQGHASALQAGIRDVVHEPFGRGPGTAGPASVYNRGHATRIAENYFIQIAQEVGWAGLGLFLAINLTAAYGLWQRRADVLSLGLLAALIGVSIVNLFSHAWGDDTLAYLWWGLAALALATPLPRRPQTPVDDLSTKH